MTYKSNRALTVCLPLNWPIPQRLSEYSTNGDGGPLVGQTQMIEEGGEEFEGSWIDPVLDFARTTQ